MVKYQSGGQRRRPIKSSLVHRRKTETGAWVKTGWRTFEAAKNLIFKSLRIRAKLVQQFSIWWMLACSMQPAPVHSPVHLLRRRTSGNLDETRVSTMTKPQRVIILRGEQQVGRVTSEDQGMTVTICLCAQGGMYQCHGGVLWHWSSVLVTQPIGLKVK